MTSLIDAELLRQHVRAVFLAAGTHEEVAGAVARVLVEGDLLGYHTHGVLLAEQYVADLRQGRAAGHALQLPELSTSSPVAAVDCRHVLGPYLVEKALAATAATARAGGVGAVALAQSHHIGCLAAYFSPLDDQDLISVIMSSNPARASVLPHGGLEPVITPNPIAVRIPTGTVPIILDISTSTVTNGTVARARKLGGRLPFPVLVDPDGTLTDDPTDVLTHEQGGILPLGGLELGYKGFALGLLVEALTSGLAGKGRRQRPEGLGASVFVMSLGADGFGGADGLVEEMQHLADTCLASTPRAGSESVRLPGSASLSRKQARSRDGIPLPADALDALAAASAAVGTVLDVSSLQVAGPPAGSSPP